VTRLEPRLVRATFDSRTVTVYQAYSPEIADAAVQAGTLVPPFSLGRMTWIKPSFGWMMHRCGRASKPGQERLLPTCDTFGVWSAGHLAYLLFLGCSGVNLCTKRQP